MRTTESRCPRPRGGPFLAALTLLAACLAESPSGPTVDSMVVQPEASLQRLVTLAWVGTYEGTGEGILLGEPASFRPARMSVHFDADSVRLERCPLCVTIVVDSLFSLTHVVIEDPVHLSVAYHRGGRSYALVADRYSTDLNTGSVLLVRLLGELPGGGAPTDIAYLFNRR